MVRISRFGKKSELPLMRVTFLITMFPATSRMSLNLLIVKLKTGICKCNVLFPNDIVKKYVELGFV